ncbi:MAG: hypothetical protein NWE88_12145 [Candidatus Bathyarchaeota archaeon]|nr:hypothetical protein [Candidatus Bathyarchaeota archaeon]
MADASERIIVLSALLLIGIIAWTSTTTPIVSLDDVRIELETEKGVYEMNEDIEVKVYFYNEKPFAVKLNTNIDKVIEGYTPEREPSPASTGHGHPIVYSEIPPNSRIKFHSRPLTPKYSGEYLISCLGANKTVLIFDPPSEGETVIAMMNKHSFKSTDEATLFITNVGLNRITLGDKYEIQKKDGDLWVEVPASLHHPNIWLMYLDLLDSGNVFRQEVTIDALEIGQYRISKTVEDSVTPESYTLIIEFEILG